MNVTIEDIVELEELELKIRAILPASYAESYEEVLPTPMGSAPLQYGIDGRVQWDEMWASFCDLAMAGGPPHRGTLLEPVTSEVTGKLPAPYQEVVEEICRGVSMVSGMPAVDTSREGWVGFQCSSVGMAAWLTRAIVMENVLVRHEHNVLYLPAGPAYRLEKEIKNVITVTAKTSHYWNDHMPETQKQELNRMFSSGPASVLVEPLSHREAHADIQKYRETVETVAAEIGRRLAVPCFAHRYVGWIGMECANVRSAQWLSRALVVESVLTRREREVVFLPVSAELLRDSVSEVLMATLSRLHRLLLVKKISG